MEHFNLLVFLAVTLAAAWQTATPIIYAAVGEIFTERAGVLNIGIEGTMLIGAFVGFATTDLTGSLALGFTVAIAAGMLTGLLFACFTVTIKANQVVVGVALNLLGLGLTSFLFRTYFVHTGSGVPNMPAVHIPILSGLPFFGVALFQQNIIVYLSLAVAFLARFVLFSTSFGLTLRATGDHPEAVAITGRSVVLYRYGAIMIGSSLAALGGAFLTLADVNQFVEGMTDGRGFIALAVVVFSRWSPVGAFFVSLIFGLFYALQLELQAQPSLGIPYQALQAMPYILTILALVFVHNKQDAPRTLGVPYNKA